MDEPFVTILFTDVVGSTSLFSRGGDEAADAVRREHFGALRLAADEHGGRVVKSTGDGLMVAFASAVAAVRCAVDMQTATTGAAAGPALRVGLDAGEPLPDGDDLYGTPVIVASRLCDAAASGQILGPRVAGLMRPAGSLRLRGVADRVATAEVSWREEAGSEDAEPEPAAA